MAVGKPLCRAISHFHHSSKRACCLWKAFNLSKSHVKGRQVLPWWVPYTCNYYCQHYYQQWHFYFIRLRGGWGSAHCPYHLHVLLATQTSSQEKSTVSTSKWDPQATDKSNHQPQNKAVKKKKKKILAILCTGSQSGLLLFQEQTGYPITFIHSEAQFKKGLLVCKEDSFSPLECQLPLLTHLKYYMPLKQSGGNTKSVG